MTRKEALAFVRRHGIVLESARGCVPNLAERVAGESVAGRWWAHPKGREIFALTRALRASPGIMVCRLVAGRITYVHERLWPALARLSTRFPQANLAIVRETHTRAGTHRVQSIPFRKWLPARVMRQAEKLKVSDAEALIGETLPDACGLLHSE
jgi:hypothetical protein